MYIYIYTYIIITGTVFARVCVCLSVCLFYSRSRERDVVAPRFLHRREELRLASCTNRFSSRNDAPLGTKKALKVFLRLRVDGRITP